MVLGKMIGLRIVAKIELYTGDQQNFGDCVDIFCGVIRVLKTCWAVLALMYWSTFAGYVKNDVVSVFRLGFPHCCQGLGSQFRRRSLSSNDGEVGNRCAKPTVASQLLEQPRPARPLERVKPRKEDGTL